jgi:EAL domain-containing protein (putative c-di-GMP-specific phosphodiesterase class I)
VLTDLRTSFTLVGTPFLEYLPVVDLSSGRLLGMEALVRWQHPTEGLIPPDTLIPQAEVSGDIGPLTRWILLEACEQANQWSPSIQLGVNCTVHQLRRGEVSKAVTGALEQTGFRAGQLTLEVTEDAIVDPDSSADLKTLSQMGVQLSVDNVGTNWSSFEPLKRHSISTLKIDGSFIKGLEQSEGINRLVVETVIHMAHSLGMSAIVESVETASQVDIVRSFTADAAQGFFFARPMSSDDAAAFAGGPDVPQFSMATANTLLRNHAGPAALSPAAAGEDVAEPAPGAGGTTNVTAATEASKGAAEPTGRPLSEDTDRPADGASGRVDPSPGDPDGPPGDTADTADAADTADTAGAGDGSEPPVTAQESVETPDEQA